jgi:hypothetical protein
MLLLSSNNKKLGIRVDIHVGIGIIGGFRMLPFDVVAQIDTLRESRRTMGAEELLPVGFSVVTLVLLEIALLLKLLTASGTLMRHFRGLVRDQV